MAIGKISIDTTQRREINTAATLRDATVEEECDAHAINRSVFHALCQRALRHVQKYARTLRIDAKGTGMQNKELALSKELRIDAGMQAYRRKRKFVTDHGILSQQSIFYTIVCDHRGTARRS